MRNERAEAPVLLQGLTARFRRGFLSYPPARLIPAAVGLASVMALTRLFSPEAFGRYALVLAAGGIIQVALGGWSRECAIRFWPGERMEGKEDALFGTAVVMALVTAVFPLSALVFVLAVPGALAEYRALLPWVGILVIAGLLYVPLGASLQAGLRARRYALWVAIRAALGLAIGLMYVFLVCRHLAGILAGLARATVNVGTLVAHEVRLVPRMRRVRTARKRTKVRPIELLNYGLPLIGWALGLETLNLADRFILSLYHGKRGSGCLRIELLPRRRRHGATHPAVACCGAAAGDARRSAGRQEDVQRPVTSASRVLLLLLLPCLAATAVLARQIAAVFLDPAYREGHLVLPLVIAGVAGPRDSGSSGQSGLQLAGRTRTMLVGVLACAAVNVALNLAVVPRWSYAGAAVATLISYSLYAPFVCWTSRRLLRWRIPRATMGRGEAAAGVMGLELAAVWGGGLRRWLSGWRSRDSRRSSTWGCWSSCVSYRGRTGHERVRGCGWPWIGGWDHGGGGR